MKLIKDNAWQMGWLLLIEPLGIETRFQPVCLKQCLILLIEPLGIETKQAYRFRTFGNKLLIEPLGIETNHCFLNFRN